MIRAPFCDPCEEGVKEGKGSKPPVEWACTPSNLVTFNGLRRKTRFLCGFGPEIVHEVRLDQVCVQQHFVLVFVLVADVNYLLEIASDL